jgi:hypothetical protein
LSAIVAIGGLKGCAMGAANETLNC